MLSFERTYRDQPDRAAPLSQEYGTTSALLISGSPNHPIDAAPAGYWTIEAPATTGGIRTAQAGRMIPFHPFDSTEGLYRIYQQPGVTPNASDFTVLAVVHGTDGVATNNLHFGRGGSSSDDSVRVYYTNANTIRFAWIDSTPSQHNLDLTVGTYFQNQILRVAITKRGTTRGLYVIDGNGARYIGTQTSGGATARSGSRGWFLGFRLNAGDGGTGRQGIAHFSTHNRAMDAGEAFDLLLSPGKVFAPRRIWVPVSAGGGGATYNETISETPSLTDSATNVATLANLLSETSAANDTAANVCTFPRALSETQTLTDTATNAATFPRSLTESQTLTDSATENVTGGATYNESLSETSSLTDSAASVLTAVGSLIETATSTDSIVVGGTYGVPLDETVTLTDTPVAPGTFSVSLSESQTLSDTYSDAANETTISVVQPYLVVRFWKRTA